MCSGLLYLLLHSFRYSSGYGDHQSRGYENSRPSLLRTVRQLFIRRSGVVVMSWGETIHHNTFVLLHKQFLKFFHRSVVVDEL